jgi:hypothetical protein
MPWQTLKIAVLLAAMLALAFFSFRAGSKMTEARYLTQMAKAQGQAEAQRARALLAEDALEQARAARQEIKTRVITRVKRETVQLPARDCGWTDAERVLVADAYCASFPTTPGCMSDPVPDPPTPAGGWSRHKPALVGD